MRDKILTLPQAVRKLTALPAQAMRLEGKGVLQVGADADINVFRLEALRERATFANPRRESEGMDTVLIRGVPALLHGTLSPTHPGTVLTRTP